MKKIVAIIFALVVVSFAEVNCTARLDGDGHYAISLSKSVGSASVNLKAYHDGFYLGGDLIHHEDRDTLNSFDWVSGYNRTFDFGGKYATDTREGMAKYADVSCEVVYALTLEQMKAIGARRDSIRKYNAMLEQQRAKALLEARQRQARLEAQRRAELQAEYEEFQERARQARQAVMDSLQGRVNLGYALIGLGTVVGLVGCIWLINDDEAVAPSVTLVSIGSVVMIAGGVIGAPADNKLKQLKREEESSYFEFLKQRRNIH